MCGILYTSFDLGFDLHSFLSELFWKKQAMLFNSLRNIPGDVTVTRETSISGITGCCSSTNCRLASCFRLP